MQLVVTRDGYTKAGWAVLGLHRAGVRAWGLVTLLSNLVFSLLLDVPLAFGEELGWRGYLLPQLSVIGRRRALLLSGLLHGIWHLPV